MAVIDRALLRAAVQESQRSARDISLKAGLGATAVKDILSGKSRSPEYNTLKAIADELGLPPAALAIEEQPARTADSRIVPRYLPVRYRVQAGNWIEVDADEPPVQVSMAVVPDARYANWPQWLELVVGDSVNMKIQPGHFAHVVDAIEMGYAPKHGDWVVVERRRGATRERTIKQVELAKDGKVRLHPRSTNPRWRDPVVLNAGANEGEEVEVEIVGKVIGSYDPEY